MKKFRMAFGPLMLLLLLALSAGCYSREVNVYISEDGSALLEITTTASQALLTYARRQANVPPEAFWFHERALRQAAEALGEGVAYLNHRIEPMEDGRRFVVTYTVANLENLRLRIDTDAPFFLIPIDELAAENRPAFRFEAQENGWVIHTPPLPPLRPATPHVQVESARARQQRADRLRQDRNLLMRDGNPFGLRGDETAHELVRHLAEGMHFRITVHLPQPLLTHNARFVHQPEEPDALPRLTLFSLQAQEVLQQEDVLNLAAQGDAHRIPWARLARAPGVKAETGDPVVLRFQPRQP